MRAIDTNALVRILVRDDERQAALAESFIEKGAWVSILALAEAMWVFASAYDRSASDVANALDMLLSHEHLTLQDADAVAAAALSLRERPALGFSDCLMLELARKSGHLPLGTFDRRLAKIPGAQKL